LAGTWYHSEEQDVSIIVSNNFKSEDKSFSWLILPNWVAEDYDDYSYHNSRIGTGIQHVRCNRMCIRVQKMDMMDMRCKETLEDGVPFLGTPGGSSDTAWLEQPYNVKQDWASDTEESDGDEEVPWLAWHFVHD